MRSHVTRRVMLGGLCGACCAGLPIGAHARVSPAEMEPLIGPGHRPTDTDEQGLWHLYERAERDIADSNLLIRDPQLTSYLGGIAERVGGPAAKDLRVYLAHVPEFNAFIAPTGFMVVFSGLLTRMRDEAQLAGVLGHEAGHFLRRHHIRSWRDTKRKSDLFTVFAMGAGLGGAAAGAYLGNAVRVAGIGALLSLAAYSRHMEAEADALGVKLIRNAGYDPSAMPAVWEQLIGETEATAAMRKKRPRRGYSLLATHPAPRTRMSDLRISAAEVGPPQFSGGRPPDLFEAVIAPHRHMLLSDQVKLNDPGGSLYIIHNLARGGWNGLLRFHEGEAWRLRGEAGDQQRSADAYAAAVDYADAPPEAWRAHGYTLLRAGHAAEARMALQRYLDLSPQAPDAAMVRQVLS